MASSNLTGTAHFIGDGAGRVHDGGRTVQWTGEASLYRLDPPLHGYTVVVASTASGVPRVSSRRVTERGVETFLWGVSGEDLCVDPEWNELPGSGWGYTAADALGEAGYRIVPAATS